MPELKFPAQRLDLRACQSADQNEGNMEVRRLRKRCFRAAGESAARAGERAFECRENQIAGCEQGGRQCSARVAVGKQQPKKVRRAKHPRASPAVSARPVLEDGGTAVELESYMLALLAACDAAGFFGTLT